MWWSLSVPEFNDRFDSIFAVCGCRWLESTVGGKSLTESA